MPSASAIRLQIETALAQKIPGALTPKAKVIHPVAATGIDALDDVLRGGLPVGALSELIGPECSGRTSVALSFLARMTRAAKVCAWIDVSNAFDPASAAGAGIDLKRLLWVRCGGSQRTAQRASRSFALPDKYLIPAGAKKGLHGGGCGGHPRSEIKGLSEAVSGLLGPEALAPRCVEPQRRQRSSPGNFEPKDSRVPIGIARASVPLSPLARMDQALRVTDLLLHGGGFSAIVLDLSSLPPEFAWRVPLATWFRYRAAAERTQASVLLLTQHACAKSSAELSLRFGPGEALYDEATVFTGIGYRIEVARRRFTGTAENVVPLRKPPQRVNAASWQSRTAWAGSR
jgi:recombination protein RecA